MDYYESALFYPTFSDEDKVRLYSVFGGIPYYNRPINSQLSVRENIIELKFRSEPLTQSMIQQEIEQVKRTGMNCYRYAFTSKGGFDVQADEFQNGDVVLLRESRTLADLSFDGFLALVVGRIAGVDNGFHRIESIPYTFMINKLFLY